METIISKGNSKVPYSNVSMTPVKSCPRACKSCYALKFYRMYPTVKNAWDNNYLLASKNREAYFDGIHTYLSTYRKSFFRWHVSGDILDQSYLDSMAKIARDYPNITFLVFTKMHELSYRNIPSNLTVIFSMFPDMKKHRKPSRVAGYAWLQDGTESRIPNTAIHCPGNCEQCGQCFNLGKLGVDVYFDKH